MTPWTWYAGEIDAESYGLAEEATREAVIAAALRELQAGDAFEIIEARASESVKHDDIVPFLRTRNHEAFIVADDGTTTPNGDKPMSTKTEAVMVPVDELADFAHVMGDLISGSSDPGTGALAAHFRITQMLSAARPATASPVGVEEVAQIIKAELVFCLTSEPDASVEIENADHVARAILASLRSPEPGGGREYVLLASYCGDDNPDCTDGRPCGECLAMCNVVGIDGRHIRELGAAPASTSEEG